MKNVKNYIPFGAMDHSLVSKLAQRLELSIADLTLLEPELYANKLPDGDTQGYTIKFKKDAPQNIIDTIKNLNSNNTVFLAYYDIIELSEEDLANEGIK